MVDERVPFVDHHVHLLAVSARRKWVGDIAQYHRDVAARGSSPMDEPDDYEPVDDLPAALRRGLQRAADLGLTGVTEAGMRTWDHWDALVELRDRDELPIDVGVLVASGAVDDLGRLRAAREASDDRLQIVGIKFYADGWLGPRTCACTHVFHDVDPPNDGILFQDADRLASRIDPLARDGFRPATHAIGDRAMDAVLDAYEQVYGGADGVRAARPRIEHAQLLRDDLIARIAELGVVCCIQPCFAASDAPHVEHGLGDDYPLAYRWDRLIAAGAEVIAGSDFPIETLDPAVGIEHLMSGPHPLDRETATRIMTTPIATG
ncbi:MAG TPA: amidohydrolase family protein [Acidimicrobiales bacterium]|jgi:predicted amidohydrolase YtcJ|nr:amidohydrolase family protein [Acidimicrobiales bacterium]